MTFSSRVAWAGNPYFSDRLADRGWRITHIPLKKSFIDWPHIVEACGGEPSLFILGDRSSAPLLRGVERFPCPTVSIFVDTHIHSWHPLYAQAFDLATVAMRDHLESFRGRLLPDDRLLWLPLFARKDDAPQPDVKQVHDLLFVGKVDADLTPGRHRFLHELAEHAPLTMLRGPYRELFPTGKLILNESERGDLNFRVFEALGCGCCLLTPDVGHGLRDLFTDGEDLFLYPPGDVRAVAELTRRLLENDHTRHRVAASGLARVDTSHRDSHRAEQFENWLAGFDMTALATERLSRASRIKREFLNVIYLHLAESCAGTDAARLYLREAKSS
ncbi:glycosyltransferase [Oceanidesulfovibrio indonesiensis]|nr:glycosyltransferase [Oceanidesulfovibrio indonesiensis]